MIIEYLLNIIKQKIQKKDYYIADYVENNLLVNLNQLNMKKENGIYKEKVEDNYFFSY